jgi:hypothetical protein
LGFLKNMYKKQPAHIRRIETKYWAVNCFKARLTPKQWMLLIETVCISVWTVHIETTAVLLFKLSPSDTYLKQHFCCITKLCMLHVLWKGLVYSSLLYYPVKHLVCRSSQRCR